MKRNLKLSALSIIICGLSVFFMFVDSSFAADITTALGGVESKLVIVKDWIYKIILGIFCAIAAIHTLYKIMRGEKGWDEGLKVLVIIILMGSVGLFVEWALTSSTN